MLTGHVHQAPFVPGGGWVDRIGTTWVFNAGQQPGPVPARVEIDLRHRPPDGGLDVRHGPRPSSYLSG